MKKNIWLVRSKAVYDGVIEGCRPLAFMVENGIFRKIMSWDEAGRYEGIPLVDYGEQLILPSFIDAHTHLFSGAVAASDYVCDDLGKCHSQSECVEMIYEFARKHPEFKRIRGMGWFLGNWEVDKLPDKKSLDKVLPDIPVYLQCADGHSMWLNSRALEEAGIQADPLLENGIIEVFPDGSLTGMLIEPAAFAPAMEKFMEFSSEEWKDIHRQFQRKLAEYGISGVSEMFADDYDSDTYARYDMVKQLDEQGEITSNIYAYTKLFGYTDFVPYNKMKEHYDSAHFKIAGVKGFLDGVTETYTGLLLEPYSDRPGSCGENLPLWPREKMQEEIMAANKAGIQVRLHCIADGSVRMALDMYEETFKVVHGNLRNTIEHIENIHPDDIPRFAQLGVIASMQPYHLTLSNNDKIFRIGEERCRYEWPVASIWKSGATVAVGTDYPVVGLNPFKTIYAAVTRRDDDTVPTGHNPWETVELSQALQAYTRNAAYVYGAENCTGSIEAGKDANFIVVDQNLFTIDPLQIQKTNVMTHCFEGKIIFQSES